jgi:hypothetical protein
MKKLVSVFIFLIIFGCEKAQDADYRDAFVATFDGISVTKCEGLGINSTWKNTISIVKGYQSDDLFVKNLGTIGYATLNNNTYIYNQMVTGSGGNNCGTTQVVKYQGTGKLVGDSLIEEGTLVISINQMDYKGTWSTRSKRR